MLPRCGRPMAVPAIDRPRAGGAAAARRAHVQQAHRHDRVVALDTVKNHVTHILGKLDAANRTETAARARQLGLIP